MENGEAYNTVWCLRAVHDNSFTRIVRGSSQGYEYHRAVPVDVSRQGDRKRWGRCDECVGSPKCSGLPFNLRRYLTWDRRMENGSRQTIEDSDRGELLFL